VQGFIAIEPSVYRLCSTWCQCKLREIVNTCYPHTGVHQRCAGAGVVSEETLAGVLTIFENRSGAGVDFSEEEPGSVF